MTVSLKILSWKDFKFRTDKFLGHETCVSLAAKLVPAERAIAIFRLLRAYYVWDTPICLHPKQQTDYSAVIGQSSRWLLSHRCVRVTDGYLPKFSRARV